jgi:two-component system, OmpR family, response regulator MprA
MVVDDDPALLAAVGRALRLDGHEVRQAADGALALEALNYFTADLIVLDVMMPTLDGLGLLAHLRSTGDRVPVLLLTARDGVNDKVNGLDTGADDYLTKPFALDELLARVRSLLRRAHVDAENEQLLSFEDLTIDVATREVHRGGRLLELTRTEFELLELLVRNARIVLRREVLFERVWGYDLDLASNSLDVYIGYLRRKTEAAGEPRLIHTVRGVGFVLKRR